MDNVSHTVAGLLLAEAAVQYRCLRGQPPPASFGRAAYWVSGVANNLPDFDFLYSRITQPPTLGYLLHHRGHTHTLPVALLLAALLLGMVQLGLRRRQSELGHADWRWLWGLALLGSLAHIAMDFTNNYGVHPFWPLHNGWFYGDFVFIIEPLFFALGVPPLLASLRSPAMRVVFVLVLGAVLVLGWSMPWVPLLVAVVITFVALIALVLAFRLPPARRIAVAFASALLVVLVFGGTHLLAKKHALSSLPAASALQDLVLTPMPANPLCWSAWRVSSKAGTYVAERGVVASLPALLSAERCSVELGDGSRERAVVRLDAPESPAVRWTGRYTAPVRALAELERESCFAAAFMRWARVPYSTERDGQIVVGDLRYDRAPEIEFAEFALPVGAPCPRFVPDWTPPREELLRGGK
ncbi:MAG TPA: metal-dependent hydrolase [Polyangiaceae bacterium]|nr:metal-dependent hydrolase [Polyangiaceae bacterium]